MTSVFARLWLWQRRALMVPAVPFALAAAARLLVPAYGAVPVLLLQCLVFGSLLALFGQTLRRGEVPLVAAVAARKHGSLSPPAAAYCRNTTLVWTLFFALQLALPLLAFAAAPLSRWPVWLTAISLPSALALFLAENAWRRWRLPDEAHVSPLETFRLTASHFADRG